MSKKAVILLSGGLDSTTVLAYAKQQNWITYAISFNYKQRHQIELQAARKIAEKFGVIEHKIFDIDLSQFGGSALTDDQIDVPDYQGNKEIPVTYVPARNIIFLSIALSFAEIIGANDIFIGASNVDYSGYPDCRPEFIQSFQKMANLGTKAGVEQQQIKIHAPLMNLDKKQTIELGLSCGVDYGMTISCYRASEQGLACGECDSCVLRKNGFAAAGLVDPTRYV